MCWGQQATKGHCGTGIQREVSIPQRSFCSCPEDKGNTCLKRTPFRRTTQNCNSSTLLPYPCRVAPCTALHCAFPALTSSALPSPAIPHSPAVPCPLRARLKWQGRAGLQSAGQGRHGRAAASHKSPSMPQRRGVCTADLVGMGSLAAETDRKKLMDCWFRKNAKKSGAP